MWKEVTGDDATGVGATSPWRLIGLQCGWGGRQFPTRVLFRLRAVAEATRSRELWSIQPGWKVLTPGEDRVNSLWRRFLRCWVEATASSINRQRECVTSSFSLQAWPSTQEGERGKEGQVEERICSTSKASYEILLEMQTEGIFAIDFVHCFFLFFPFIFISWRLITLQYCSGFCHTLTWISHGFMYIVHCFLKE